VRVALVIDRLDPARGGGEGYAVSLAKALCKRGHDVHVYAHTSSGPLEGIHFHALPMMSYPRWAKVLSMALSARQAVKGGSFDVIQGFGGTPWVDVYRPGGGLEIAWLRQDVLTKERRVSRLFYLLKQTLSLKFIMNIAIEKAIYKNPKGPIIIANSNMVKEHILDVHNKMNPDRIEVIYNGVDLRRFHPQNRETLGRDARQRWGLGDSDMVILFMAHNFRLKGLLPLIRALSRLRGHSTRWILLVAGRGNPKIYQREADRLGIYDRVKFVNQVQRPETALASCDLLVHPTFYDPFSNVCLEAMASGVPVITSRYNGASEVLREGVSGYLVSDPREEGELSIKIEALMDPRKRKQMGIEARKDAEKYSLKFHVAKVEDVYEKVIKGKKAM